MKLSIIILTYNQEKYISKTIDSIISQIYKFDSELIICDDASTDSTPEIIKEYQYKYPNLIRPILRNKNLGVVRNYYDGISHAIGEYIMVCGGDDYWLPDKVRQQIDVLDQSPEIGMVYSDAKCVNENEEFIKIYYGDADNSIQKLIKADHVCASSVAFRRKLILKYIEEVNPINKDWKMEDYPFILWVSLVSKISYIKCVNVVYRVLSNSLSNKLSYHKALKFDESDTLVKIYFTSRYESIRNLKSKYYLKLCIIQLQLSYIENSYNRLEIRKNICKYLHNASLKDIIKLLILHICPRRYVMSRIK